MRHALKLHPDSRCNAVARIEVEAARPKPAVLALTYVVTGAMADVRLPPPAAPERGSELWRRTCFEAFVRAQDPAYLELNFAPSRAWAAYRFRGYRAGMTEAAEVVARGIEVRAGLQNFTLNATVDLHALTSLPDNATWRLGLSVVIEEANGRLSYWALAHPAGKPDFHHSDCFALELGPASRP